MHAPSGTLVSCSADTDIRLWPERDDRSDAAAAAGGSATHVASSIVSTLPRRGRRAWLHLDCPPPDAPPSASSQAVDGGGGLLDVVAHMSTRLRMPVIDEHGDYVTAVAMQGDVAFSCGGDGSVRSHDFRPLREDGRHGAEASAAAAAVLEEGELVGEVAADKTMREALSKLT